MLFLPLIIVLALLFVFALVFSLFWESFLLMCQLLLFIILLHTFLSPPDKLVGLYGENSPLCV